MYPKTYSKLNPAPIIENDNHKDKHKRINLKRMFSINKMSILEKIMKTKEEKYVSDLDDLRDDEECTICLYIPYEKFQSFSFNEIE